MHYAELRKAAAELTGPGGQFEIVEADVLGQRLRVYRNAPPSVREFWLSTAAWGDRPYLLYQDERITYAQGPPSGRRQEMKKHPGGSRGAFFVCEYAGVWVCLRRPCSTCAQHATGGMLTRLTANTHRPDSQTQRHTKKAPAFHRCLFA